MYLGLDVGGTKVAAAVVDATGTVRARRRASTRELRATGDPLAGVIALGQEVLRAASLALPAGVGIGLPGPVGTDPLRMLAAPTIPEVEQVPLETPLREAFGCTVAGANDADACALAEARFGAGKGMDPVLYITVSTGIGGGMVAGGKVWGGAHGTAGEVGHQVLLAHGGPACDCGSCGCLEALASGRGIAGRAGMPAERCAELARKGNAAALRVWEDTGLYLGLGVANAINLLDPAVVVLGGGVVAGAADLLLPRVRAVVKQRCMPSLLRPTEIRAAVLGEDAGVVGAAVLAMTQPAG